MKIDDKELEKIFVDISQNRAQGIEELYNKYKKIVYAIAFTISKNNTDAEDIVQIVFTKIYEIDESKLPINKQSSWFYSITKNETINFLKKKKNDIPLDKIYEISDDNRDLNKVIDNIEFNRLISKLNEKEKEIVSLKILSNFSFEEISNLLNEPIGTIKWRYYKSIYSLKAILGNLAMFIISFIIGVKALFSSKQCQDISQIEKTDDNSVVQVAPDNTIISEENIFQDKSQDYNSQTSQDQSIREDIITNTIQEDNNTVQENIIYQEQPNNNYNQYVGYSFLGISIIFLSISLYFFIKYQLKHLKKLSK